MTERNSPIIYLFSIVNGKVATKETERIKPSDEFCNLLPTLKTLINSVSFKSGHLRLYDELYVCIFV